MAENEIWEETEEPEAEEEDPVAVLRREKVRADLKQRVREVKTTVKVAKGFWAWLKRGSFLEILTGLGIALLVLAGLLLALTLIVFVVSVLSGDIKIFGS